MTLDMELLTLMLAASERPPIDLGLESHELESLARDIEEAVSHYGLELELTHDDIRAVLPAFLAAALANADANEIQS
jgi:hypothetical protein